MTPTHPGARGAARSTRAPRTPTLATVLSLTLALALAAAGCSRPTTHHRPGTNHDTTTNSVAPATQPPDDAGSDLPGTKVPGSDGSEGGESTTPHKTVEIEIADGRVSPPPGRVELRKGVQVRLTVTSDRDDELHVHGLDVGTELPAGETTTYAFTPTRTGVFEVETHASHLVLTQLVVR
ncbi:hypothetical protein ACFQLX_12750 [Streptomyces polyrhachis]|uniref:EfeO-type cupredoxin-like domain-containing protein n=1 Tax=Streptomyces polyrhachis TaxID=1282885 RepID=A0ABW2GGF8_9ACTN